MGQTPTISASEFKAKCLDLLDRLAGHEIDRITITKRGRVVAVLTPPEREEAAVQQLHGFMRGSVLAPEGLDLTAPVLDEDWAAEQGELHG